MKIIPNLTPFPCDAESSPFFGALATALLPALGYTEETPYFCAPNGGNCKRCGNCDCSKMLRKHHLQLYHDYQTFTGVSFGWAWPEDGSDYNIIPDWEKSWFYPEPFLDLIYGHAGLSWAYLTAKQPKDEVVRTIRASVDAGYPVLMKFAGGPAWHVVAGCDDDGTLYALDGRHLDTQAGPTVATEGYTEDGYAILKHWLGQLQMGILITGKTEKTVCFSDILTQIILSLSSNVHKSVERDVMARLDAITACNAGETAQWLLERVAFPIEARWHAADSSLIRQHDNKAVQDKIFIMISQYVFDGELDATHGTCWKIWGQLGVGPETGYALPPDAAKRLVNPETQSELKRLFGIVFENDRIVLKALREAAECSLDFTRYPIPTVSDLNAGHLIKKTMRLLEESTTEAPNKVKIAFTGQSIVDPNNSWPPNLADHLRQKYPSARIQHKVFAIGGFATQILYKRVPNDIASFYPDLVVIYVTGSEVQYEQLVKWIRENTTAEILILTDHFTTENWWSTKMAYELLPAIAVKYRCQIADVRTYWRQYFKGHPLTPQGLLSDGTHLNASGQTFMLEIIKQFFVYNEGADEVVREECIPICAGDWVDGKLTVPFTGNRVEVVPVSEGFNGGEVTVRVDGLKPSERADAYIRSAENIGIKSVLGIVSFHTPPGEQTFTVTIDSFKDDRNFTYTVIGSATGAEGTSDNRGTLHGKHVSMTHESFIFYPGYPAPAPGTSYSFTSLLNGTDVYGTCNPYKGGHPEKEELFDQNMLISGISVGSHTLELTAKGAIPDIRAIKVYHPR